MQSTLENSKVNCMVWAAAEWDTVTAAIGFHMPVFIGASCRQCWMCPSYNCSWDQSIRTQHSISYILVTHMQFHSIMSSTYCSLLKMKLGGNVSYKCHRNEWRAKWMQKSTLKCPYSFSNWMCVFVSFCKLFNQGSSFTKLNIPLWVLCQWRTSMLYFLASHNQY